MYRLTILRRPGLVTGFVVLALVTSGCQGLFNVGRGVSDDLASQLGRPHSGVLDAAEHQVRTTGRGSVDDVMKDAQSHLERARTAYSQVPGPVREEGCKIAARVESALWPVTAQTVAELEVAQLELDRVASAYGHNAVTQDLDEIIAGARGGRPEMLTASSVRSAICTVAGL